MANPSSYKRNNWLEERTGDVLFLTKPRIFGEVGFWRDELYVVHTKAKIGLFWSKLYLSFSYQ